MYPSDDLRPIHEGNIYNTTNDLKQINNQIIYNTIDDVRPIQYQYIFVSTDDLTFDFQGQQNYRRTAPTKVLWHNTCL